MPHPPHHSNLGSGLRPVQVGDTLRGGQYTVLRELNHGGSATVYECLRASDGMRVAVKVIYAKDGTRTAHMSLVRREVRALTRVNDPRVVRLLDVFAEGCLLVLVLELVEGQDLLDLLNEDGGRFTEGKAAFFLRQTIEAVRVVHAVALVHRDIKPENIVVDRATSQLKLVDFGLSKDLESCLTLAIGTAGYMAPELVLRDGPEDRTGDRTGHGSHHLPPSSHTVTSGRYDGALIDAWSVGVMAFLLTNGFMPWEQPEDPDNAIKTIQNIQNQRRAPYRDGLSAQCRDFLDRLLVFRPQDRSPLDAIASHPWLLEQSEAYLATHLDLDVDLETETKAGEREGRHRQKRSPFEPLHQPHPDPTTPPPRDDLPRSSSDQFPVPVTVPDPPRAPPPPSRPRTASRSSFLSTPPSVISSPGLLLAWKSLWPSHAVADPSDSSNPNPHLDPDRGCHPCYPCCSRPGDQIGKGDKDGEDDDTPGIRTRGRRDASLTGTHSASRRRLAPAQAEAVRETMEECSHGSSTL